MQIAPWLQPTNVLGAIQAGSQLGLNIRAQQQAAAEAAQRMAIQQQAQQLQAQEANARMLLQRDSLMQQLLNQQANREEKAYETDARIAQANEALGVQRELGHRRLDQSAEENAAAQALRERHQNALEEQFRQKMDADSKRGEWQAPESINATPIVDPRTGEVLGMAAASRGGLHMLNPQKPDAINAKPSDFLGAIRTAQSEIANPALWSTYDEGTKSNKLQRLGSLQAQFDSLVGSSPKKAVKTKVQLAREISALHPEWDKARVIKEVNSTFQGE